MEELAIYNCKFVYIKGEHNTVADALSRYPHDVTAKLSDIEKEAHHPYKYSADEDIVASIVPVCSVMNCVAALISANPEKKVRSDLKIDEDLITEMKNAYKTDEWCQKLISASKGMKELTERDGLWFIGNRMVIPCCRVREHIFALAHDVLGHFGFAKTYQSIRDSYFWPNMRKDLEEGYIPSCIECQKNKSSTTKPSGPLHPLPVPDERFESVAIDFIGPLPKDGDSDSLTTMTCRLGADVRLCPTEFDQTAEELVVVFFDNWYCENGLPKEIICDRDRLFVSKFWKHLMLLTGVKIKMSTSFHPQTDGSSERTNKTVEQCLRFHVERNQKGWKRALPRVRFQMMNTINKSTKYTPFQLRLGKSPRVIPTLVEATADASKEQISARAVCEQIAIDVSDARDNLMVSKIAQAYSANTRRSEGREYKAGDWVMLSTINRRKEYKNADEKRVAKFMPRFDGPYEVMDANNEASVVELQIPSAPNIFPKFHTSLVKPFHQNDDSKFPSRTLTAPGPVEVDGEQEYYIERITDHKKVGRSYKYLVRWTGEHSGGDRWIAENFLLETEALEKYWQNRTNGEPSMTE